MGKSKKFFKENTNNFESMDAEAARAMEVMNELQTKSMVELFNLMSARCFQLCVSNVNDDLDLTSKEAVCLKGCIGKWQSFSRRVMLVFTEENARISKRDVLLDKQQHEEEEEEED